MSTETRFEPSPAMLKRNQERDVRDSSGWTNNWSNGPTLLVDWIGIHPSRDYDLMFYHKDRRGPLPFVYCKQHMRAHATGWCTVGPEQKVPLFAPTLERAHQEVKEAGWPVYGETPNTRRNAG